MMSTTSTTEHPTKRRPRSVSFGPTSERLYDSELLPGEHELIWHDPFELKEQARKDIGQARQLWRQNGIRHNYCWRGLEKRLKSADAAKKKWYKFLHSFLSLQSDLKKLNSDNSNLLMIFVSAHSKAGRMQAHHMGLQDEAEAFRVHTAAAAAAAGNNTGTATGDNMLREQILTGFARKLTLEGGPPKSPSGGNLSAANNGPQERIGHRARSA